MTNKRKTLAAALLLSLTLVGCGGGGNPGSGDTGGGTTGGGTTGGGGNYDNGVVITPVTYSGEEASALTLVNKIRTDAGLRTMSPDKYLTIAAEGHANYLVTNKKSSHYEDPSLPAYYENSPQSRATKAGWESGASEVVAFKNTGVKSVENLMTAIYHRFGLLGEYNSVGMSQMTKDGFSAFVADMGTAGTGNPAPGTPYFLWPAKGINYGGRYFTGETPNPLVDMAESASGNPISVNFNKYEVDCSAIEMKNFSLTVHSTGYVEPVLKTMTEATDPNNRFTACEFAMFSENILLENTQYDAQFDYTENGAAKSIKWSFGTKAENYGEDAKLNYSFGNSHTFTVNRGEKYLLLPNTRNADELKKTIYLLPDPYDAAGPVPNYTFGLGWQIIEFSGTSGTLVFRDTAGTVITFNIN